MPALEAIDFSDIAVVEMRDAPHGSILQVAMPNTSTSEAPASRPGVCIRSQLTAAGGVSEGVVWLEGAIAGQFFAFQDFASHLALDISLLVKLAVHEPAPIADSMMNRNKTVGKVAKVVDRNGTAYLGMGVRLPQSTSLQGYVGLGKTSPGIIGPAREVIAVLGWLHAIKP